MLSVPITSILFSSSPVCSNYKFACAHEQMNAKKRSTMEDCHRIVPDLLESLQNVDTQNKSNLGLFSYFGVYDGHGGRQIVDFLDETLERNIGLELLQPDDADIKERLMRAFLITDMQSRRNDITVSGATAVCALIKNDENLGRCLYVANVGDSRAVLISQKGNKEEKCKHEGYFATRLSYDHRAEDEDEQKRIKEAGGFITRQRVLGILAVSRSFGDHGMKDFVTANPYITETFLKERGSTPFLILACDGVWDVMSDQEAGDLILDKYNEIGQFEDAAKLLVQTAIEKGSADNVTALVIFL
jgi:serine/threonine protein phosphatase PrpC